MVDMNMIHISINNKLYKYSDSCLNRITRLQGSQWWIAWALSASLWSLWMCCSWRWCTGQTSRWEIPAWNSSVHFFWFKKFDLITGSTKQKAHQLLVFQQDGIRAPKWWYRTSQSLWWYLCEKNRRGRQWEAHLKQGELLRCQMKSGKVTPALQCIQWNQVWRKSFHEDGHFRILWLSAPYQPN